MYTFEEFGYKHTPIIHHCHNQGVNIFITSRSFFVFPCFIVVCKALIRSTLKLLSALKLLCVNIIATAYINKLGDFKVIYINLCGRNYYWYHSSFKYF